MSDGSRIGKAPRLGEAGWIFLLSMLLYALTSPGHLTGDSEVRWAVATRIVESGWVDLPADSTPLAAKGRDGKFYSYFGPGQPVFLAPFAAAGKVIGSWPGLGSSQAGQFLASLIFFPACGAAAVAVLYLIVYEATGRRRPARWAAMLLAVATMHWTNSTNTYEESQVSLCLLASVWAVQRYWQRDRMRYLLAALGAMGLGLTFRISGVVVFAAVGMVALAMDLWRHRAHMLPRIARWVAAGVLGLGPFLAGLAWFNWARFGSPLETGYVPAHRAMGAGIRLFETPLLTGLGGLLVSPGKSVLLYNPVLILSVVGFVGFWRGHRPLAWMIAAAFAANVLFHAKYTFWAGDLAWGPRYLASVMGLCVIPAVGVLRSPRLRRAALGVTIVSVCIQMASIVYGFGLEYFQDRRHGTIPDGYVWRAGESQLLCRLRNIALDAAGRPNYQSIPPLRVRPETHQRPTSPEEVRRVHAVNIFPFKALAILPSTKLFYPLLGAWIAGLAALTVMLVSWRRRIGRCWSDPPRGGGHVPGA